jgi:pSer/pThr/pTyr-binding forkhead associated (FHA) protein
MDSEVIITLVDELHGEKRFVFSEPWICLVGRANDCDIQVPSDESSLEVSRHHCLLEINPPQVRVRDLGSTNGTFVNGQRIGPRRRVSKVHPDDTEPVRAQGTELHDGDEIQMARTPIRLTVEVRGIEADEPQTVGSNRFDFN